MEKKNHIELIVDIEHRTNCRLGDYFKNEMYLVITIYLYLFLEFFAIPPPKFHIFKT